MSLPIIDNSIRMDSLRIKFKLMSTVANSTLKLNLSDGSYYPENMIEFASITPTVLNTWQDYEVWIDTANALFSIYKVILWNN